MIERGEIIETWERENTRLCANGTRAIFAMSPSITAPRGANTKTRSFARQKRGNGGTVSIVIIIIIVIVIVIVTG